LVSYGLAFAAWPRVSAAKRAAAERAYSAAKTEWEGALSRWKREASRHAFAEKLKALEEKVHAEMADLPNERRRRLAKLEAEREMRQRQRYLDRFRIDRAKIRRIGSGRVAMLASYGIETAADIEGAKIMRILGFGETLTSELVRW
jgi:DNA-binding helix-hairpin-helix protein with protein kinase domain